MPFKLLLSTVALLLCASAHAAVPPLPSEGGAIHVGAASCAGSTCHGATKPGEGSNVRQDEFLTWERQDPHSKAYKSLTGEAGKRIASNLGLKSSTGPECLVCHADNVPARQQGKRFKLAEGVGCEACHGGSEKWFGSHLTATSHAENLAAGLYPLEDPAARALVCQSCHQGSARNPVTHRLMGAGHPPLNGFELDTYTETEPAHFRVDADYRKRKQPSSSAKTWITGQLRQSATLLEALQGPQFAQHGLFPELAFYDCDGCHHPMNAPRWTPGLGGALEAGEVRLADTMLVMSAQIIATLQPDKSSEWDGQLDRLRTAGRDSIGDARIAAQRLQTQLNAVSPALESREPTPAEIRTLLQKVVADAQDRSAASYSHAAQTTLAIGALSNSLGEPSPALKKAIDGLFKATENRPGYDPAPFRKALQEVRAQVGAR